MQAGVNKTQDYLLELRTDEVLSASTLLPQSFSISDEDGIYSPKVTHVKYLPLDKMLKIYLEPNEFLVSGPYNVTSDGVTNCYDENVDINESVYVKTEKTCSLYDISVKSIAFSVGGKQYLVQPQEESFEATVTVINSSNEKKSASLVFSAEASDLTVRQLAEQSIELEGGTTKEVSNNFRLNKNELLKVSIN